MAQPSLTGRRAAMLTAVLGLLSIFPPLATDMYLAAIGQLAEAMNASHAAAELSLSMFFLGLCAGQLVMGPLIDGYGRKPPLLAGIVLFFVTSLALPLIENIAVFNALRFVQAVGASAGIVVGRAVINDLYTGRQAAKSMTVLVMLLTIGPIVSPTLGSLLLGAFGWRSIFYSMALISGLALFLTLWLIPETLPLAARAGQPFRSGRKAAAALLRHRGFVLPAVIAGLVQGGMFAFITGSSGVFQGVFGLSALAFGLVFALIAAALVLFGQLNTMLLNRFRPGQILVRGLPLYVLAGGLALIQGGAPSLGAFVAALWVSVGMVGLLSANAMALAMSEARAASGMGSALLGGIQFAMAFTVSGCVALGGTDSALPLSLGIVLPALAAMLLSFGLQTGAGAEASGQANP